MTQRVVKVKIIGTIKIVKAPKSPWGTELYLGDAPFTEALEESDFQGEEVIIKVWGSGRREQTLQGVLTSNSQQHSALLMRQPVGYRVITLSELLRNYDGEYVMAEVELCPEPDLEAKLQIAKDILRVDGPERVDF